MTTPNIKAPRDLLDVSREQHERAEHEKQVAKQRQIEIDDFRWLMRNKQGRRVMWRLLSKAGIFQSGFASDAMLMAHREGFKDYGRWLITEIEQTCPELYLTMLTEQHDYANGKR